LRDWCGFADDPALLIGKAYGARPGADLRLDFVLERLGAAPRNASSDFPSRSPKSSMLSANRFQQAREGAIGGSRASLATRAS
jgi:hypothetical protein